jgi:hypothetical protein
MKMFKNVFTLFLAFVTFFIILAIGESNSTKAQSAGATTANITGTVEDSGGAAISSARITARNLATNLTRETITNEDGSYLITQLPPGSYEMTVVAAGFTKQTTRLDLILGTTLLFNYHLKIGEVSEVIEVKAGNTLEGGKTESSTNVDQQRIESLPINRRNFMEFSLTAARVSLDRVPTQGVAASSGISFNGQPARYNNITIDGLDNNESASGSTRSTFSQDAVQEFQIISDSYSAEFGRAAAGVVNIITKGGSNELHTNFFLFNRNDKISSRDVFAPFEPEYKQYQFGAALSGPIKRDRAFFFTSFERLSIKQSNFVTISDETVRSANRIGLSLRNGPIPFALGTSSLLGRFDGQISSNDSFFVRYNGGFTYNGQLETFGALLGETNSGIQRLNDNSIAASNTYISPALNLINETRFLFSRRNQDVFAVDPGPQVRLVAPEGTVVFGRGTFLPQTRQERIYQIVDNVSLARGRNQIKFGIDFVYIKFPENGFNVPLVPGGLVIFQPLNFSALTGIPGLPSFTGLQTFDPSLRTAEQRAFLTGLAASLPDIAPGFPAGLPLADLSLPFAYVQGFGNSFETISAKFFSVFIQNDIKLKPNLMIKAGLRYDINKVTFVPDNRGNFSPRLALSYKPEKAPSLTFRASYGLFFSVPFTGPPIPVGTTTSENLRLPIIPFPFSVLPFALPGHHFPDSEKIPSGVTFVPQLSQILTNQPDLRSTYTQQINTGIDYLIGNHTLISATYNFVRGIKVFAARNINPIVRPIPTNPVLSAIIGRSDPTRGEVFEFESAFDSYYHSFTISINQRFARRFNVLAHYTYSKAIDNFIDFRIESGLLEIVDPLKPGSERGLSLQDLRNRFVLSGIWELNYTNNRLLRDFQLSTILNLNSGRPYNLLAGVDLNMNGDNPPGDRPTGLGRNVGITPGFANVDLRLTRTAIINERYKLQGFIEIFNLFNRVNIDPNVIDRTFTPDAQGRFTLPVKEGGRFIVPRDRYRGAFSPRQFQLGVRVTL